MQFHGRRQLTREEGSKANQMEYGSYRALEVARGAASEFHILATEDDESGEVAGVKAIYK
jgi:ABC-type branched-subunit amino acid transport system ATPase component